MKNMSILTLVVLFGPSAARATDPAAAPTTMPTNAASTILAAPDASGAVTAFANALAGNKEDPAVYRAYVRKMVDLNLPQLAGDQAQTLTKLDPRSGLGWAVQAYLAAGKNDYRMALATIRQAAEFLPEDSFVARTAAQIMGWYDTHYKYADLPKEYRTLLSQLTQKFNDRPEFAIAYRTTLEDLAPRIPLPAKSERGGSSGMALTGAQPHPSLYGSTYAHPSQQASLPPVIRPPYVYNNYTVNSLQMLPPQNVPPPVYSGMAPSAYTLGVPSRYYPGVGGTVIITGGGGSSGGGERE